jgi:hypothetical protein
MAKKKPRTPTPPRVQAPRQRTDQRKSPGLDMGMGQRNALYAFSAAGVVGLIVVVLIVVLAGGGGGTNDKKVAAAMTAAGCSFKTVKAYVPPGQSTHVNSLTSNNHWNTSPPSNGQHYPEWAIWGFYTQAINPHQVVHNEEHGGVIYWWGSSVPQKTVAALRTLYNQQPDGTFGTPYAKLGSKIAITAWTGNTSSYQQNGYYGFGHIATCAGTWTPKVKTAFTTFRDVYRGKGPEGIPLCADEPGDSPTVSSC